MIKPTIIECDVDLREVLDRFSTNRKACSILLQIHGIVTVYSGTVQKLYEKSLNVAAQNKLLQRGILGTTDPRRGEKVIKRAYSFFANVAFANGLARSVNAFYQGLELPETLVSNLKPSAEDIGDFVALVATNAPPPWEEMTNDSRSSNSTLLSCLTDLSNAIGELSIDADLVVLGVYTEDMPDKDGQVYLYGVPYEQIKDNINNFFDTFEK